jgi:hypothetical protein
VLISATAASPPGIVARFVRSIRIEFGSLVL